MQPAPPSRTRVLWIAAAAVVVLLGAGAAMWFWLGRGTKLPRPGEPAYEEYAEAFEAGTAALDAGLNDVAEKELTRAVGLVPAEPAAWANRGLAYLRSQQPNKARPDLARAS